jgi:U4/U6.U5 tri-snRNP component SNU23
MSENLNYSQATNVERRTWDTATYEQRVQARASSEKSGQLNEGPVPQLSAGDKRKHEDDKEEFTPAAPGAAGPEKSERAFLKARRNKVDIDSKVGTSEMVSVEAATTTKTGDITDGVTKTGVGWHCKVCDCFLKDSHTYLDHINGRKHQRNLGYSMRVERSTKDQVQERLKQLVKKRETHQELGASMTAEHLLKAKDEELEKRKQDRIKRREERKKNEEDEKQEVGPQIDPAIAAMMGFSGFGGGNKNR